MTRPGVNAALTADGRDGEAGLIVQPARENDEYAAMLRRMIVAYGRRVGFADPYDLADMLDVRETLTTQIQVAVDLLRAQGYSWTEIGDGAGLSRQAAQQRWGSS